jgi:hypothetical protein
MITQITTTGRPRTITITQQQLIRTITVTQTMMIIRLGSPTRANPVDMLSPSALAAPPSPR